MSQSIRSVLVAVTTIFVTTFITSLACAASPRIAPELSTIVKAKKQDDDAEVLWSSREVKLNQDGSWKSQEYVAIRVNNADAARDYGRIKIAYNHYYTSMSLDFANTLNKQNELKPVLESAIQNRVTGDGQDFYSDRSEFVFSLPDIAPGSVIEFQYSIESKVIALEGLYSTRVIPFWFQSTAANDGWRADFVHHHEFTIQYPKSVAFQKQPYSTFDAKEKQKSNGDFYVSKWVSKKVKAIKHEVYIDNSEALVPQLRLSTLSDWSSINDWTWEKVEDKFILDQKLQEVVKQLPVTAASSKQEKIEAVYEYLQDNIRYVFAHIGRGGYEPHFPRETLEAGYGDCKDQSVLATALLRALGVTAYPALIETPRAGDSDAGIVDLIFDHMIVHIPAQEGAETRWLDTTGDRGLFPGVSNYLVSQNVLIINAEDGVFTTIEPEAVAENVVRVETTYTVDEQERIVADVVFSLSGMFEQRMRSWWMYESDKNNQLQQFLKGLYNLQLEFSVEGSVANAEEVFKPIELTARYVFEKDKTADQPAAAASIAQLVNVYVEPGSLPSPDTRVNRFIDNYPFRIEYHVTFDGGEKYLPALVQSIDGYSTEFYTLNFEREKKDTKYSVRFKFTRNALNLNLSEYKYYYESINNILKFDPWIVSMQPRLESIVKEALSKEEQEHGKNSVQYLTAKANGFIDQGRFEDALQAAKEAVEMDSSSGHAWYVLGTAQGLNALFEESSKSFAMGESLGYRP